MRGKPVSKSSTGEFEFVVIAARYGDEGGNLDLAQVYERRGPIWGDVKLLGRAQILELIKSGRKMVVGNLASLPGDFTVVGPLKISKSNGSECIVVGEGSSSHDDLQVPQF